MYDKIIKQMQDSIEELKEKVERLESENRELRADVNGIDDDIEVNHKLARAVCELQEEVQRNMPEVYFINRINAPTRVGMN
tara:strand:- start:5326 stop:5568 length:243 start_codon:yes stop_codon:yes gene_type:complete